MTDKQPEALRLANALDSDFSPEWMQGITLKHISDELRRLHEVNVELVEELQAVEDLGEMSLQLIYPSREAADKAKAALAKAQSTI